MCGIVGHVAVDCSIRYDKGVDPNSDSLPYGSWLRAKLEGLLLTASRRGVYKSLILLVGIKAEALQLIMYNTRI